MTMLEQCKTAGFPASVMSDRDIQKLKEAKDDRGRPVIGTEYGQCARPQAFCVDNVRHLEASLEPCLMADTCEKRKRWIATHCTAVGRCPGRHNKPEVGLGLPDRNDNRSCLGK